jgi:transcriptional regulator with PAS, ATPase and Fis domain
MSSRHAVIRATGSRAEIVDDGSKNGTFVNGQRLTAPYELCDGDVIECGHSFFVYRDGSDSSADVFQPRRESGPLQIPPLYYQVAPLFPYIESDVSIHLQGETGTGKEVVARAIHDLSGRPGPFVARNCAAIPDSLFESELFGYVKGAFSGASGSQRGQILAADHGTLFLDEIGELSLVMQAKLLRVLELKEVLPLGASHPIAVDFRLISATLKDIKAQVAEGRFRADLYGRLGHVARVPSLREHREEMGRLVATFLVARLSESPKPAPKLYFTLAAARALVAYSWPYNVRELRHCIHSAFMAAVAESQDGFCAIKQRHLPIALDTMSVESLRPSPAFLELPELSDERVLDALRAADGNRTEAARLLGVSDRTVFRRLRKLRQRSS